MVETQLIDDPWRELSRERQKQTVSITHLKRILQRIELRDATGRPAERFCPLCRDVPMGLNPAAWQKQCPGHLIRDYVQEHAARLNQAVRKPKTSRGS